MEELLSYSHVDIAFRGNTVVHDVSFELHPGEILGIVGESGSGKSTLLKAAMGLLGRDGMVTRGDNFFPRAGHTGSAGKNSYGPSAEQESA